MFTIENRRFIESVLDNYKDILHLSQDQIKNMSYEQLKGGSNINYKVSFNNYDIFLKHNPKPVDATIYGDTLKREFKILTYLYNESKLTPEPYMYDEYEHILITEFVHGKMPSIHDKDFFNTLTL